MYSKLDMEDKRKISTKIILIKWRGGSDQPEEQYLTFRSENELKDHTKSVSAFLEEDQPLEEKMIVLPNKGFKLFFSRIIHRYYGSEMVFRIYHDDFEKYPSWGWNETSLLIKVDPATVVSIFESTNLIEGKLDDTYTIDTFRHPWYQSSTCVVSDRTPQLDTWKDNYSEYFEGKRTSSLVPGNIYVNRWGDLFLALKNNIYSQVLPRNSYRFLRYYGISVYPTPQKSTLMIQLKDRALIDEKTRVDTLEKLEELFSEQPESGSFMKLRAKRQPWGKFVKIYEVPGLKDLLDSIPYDIVLTEFLKSFERIFPGARPDEQFFHFLRMSEDKTMKTLLDKTLANEFRSLFETICTKRVSDGPGWKETERYGYVFNPSKPLSDVEIEEMIEFLPRKTLGPSIGLTSDELIARGIYQDKTELIKFLDKARGYHGK